MGSFRFSDESNKIKMTKDGRMKMKRSVKSIIDKSPRLGRGRVPVLTVMFLTISLLQFNYHSDSLNSKFQSLINFYGKLLFPLTPLLIVIYFIYWNKAGSLHLFNTLFLSVNSEKKIVVKLATMCLIVLYWWLNSSALLLSSSFLTSLLTSFIALSVFLKLGLHRNNIEDEVKISRSPYNIAPGLARSFFTVIEGVITGKIGGKSYKDSLADYKKENRLDEKDWISNKVVILFLESDKGHKP